MKKGRFPVHLPELMNLFYSGGKNATGQRGIAKLPEFSQNPVDPPVLLCRRITE
jgi:hypothetical protein